VVLGVSQDVTDRKRLEEQCRQAQTMDALARLAGRVAHDFNNLLTVVLGNSELLGEAGLGPFETDLARDIHDSATRAAALSRQLLTFSRRQPARPRRSTWPRSSPGWPGRSASCSASGSPSARSRRPGRSWSGPTGRNSSRW